MTKIDLDDLERQLRAASASPLPRGVDCSVALALTLRIRELEAALLRAGHTFSGDLPPPDVKEFIALLEKGAVLP